MGVSLYVPNQYYEIGHSSFFKSFFDTIHFHLVKGNWGSKYPKLFIDFYQGHLKWEDVAEVIENLEEIRNDLKKFSPQQVIWDINDLSKQPPWGGNINSRITSLSNYFVTSNGKDLFEVLINALNNAIRKQSDVYIR